MSTEQPPSKELLDEAAKFIEGFATSGESGFIRQQAALKWLRRYRAQPSPEPRVVPSKFDLAFEIMRLLEAEEMDTMQSCHFGYVLRVTREGSAPPPFPDGLRDIVEALDARGDDLSVRAARYIRLKLHMLAGREAEIRHMAASHSTKEVR